MVFFTEGATAITQHRTQPALALARSIPGSRFSPYKLPKPAPTPALCRACVSLLDVGGAGHHELDTQCRFPQIGVYAGGPSD
jgi:hypothetical protein